MNKILFILLLASILGLYLLRLQATRRVFKEGDRVRVSSTISEDPSIEGYQQKITLEGLKIYINRFPEYNYGDYISVEGEVARGKGGYFLRNAEVLSGGSCRELSPAENPQGGPSGGSPCSRHPLGGQSPTSPAVGMLGIRERVLQIYSENLPEPHSGLLSGIVLGTKNSLEKGFLDKLRDTGTLHIVVASGTNISIFAGGLLYFLINIFKAHRKLAIVVSLIFIWVYIFFIGYQPPIVRAGIMASIAFVAQILGREGEGLRALILSVIVMLLVVPQWLFDLGFQLSFLATLGIITISPNIERKMKSVITNKWGLRNSLAITLAAQVAVLPLIYYKFGSFPLISPLVNVLVVPVVPVIMIGGFVLGGLGVLGALEKIFSWFIFIPLEYFVRIIDLFS